MNQYITGMQISHTAAVEVTEDFEMPEYRPEIRKAAGVQCTVTRDNAFLEGGTAEVSGCVLYTVLYLNGEGGLTSVPFYTTWQAKIPLPEEGGIGVEDLYITAEGENITCRITGPRKLTLSARVRLRCTALGKTDCKAETDGGEGIVLRKEETPAVGMKTCRRTGTVSGEVTGGNVIFCRGSVLVGETHRTPEGLAVTGEAVVQALTLGENGTYTPIRCRAAIREVIPCPAAEEGAQQTETAAAGTCAALTVTGGEDGVIGWEMEYDLEGMLLSGHTAVRAADGYCTVCEDTPVFRQAEAVTGGYPVRGQITLTGEKHLRGDDTAGLQFLCGWGRGVFERGEALPGGRILLTGTAHCTVLLTGNGEIVSEEAALPIRYEYDPGQSGGVGESGVPDCRCSFAVPEVNGHMEGTVLHLHAEAVCNGIVLHRQETAWLQALTCHRDRPLPRVKPALILYTPEAGETLWDVQKRYRTENAVQREGRYVIRK